MRRALRLAWPLSFAHALRESHYLSEEELSVGSRSAAVAEHLVVTDEKVDRLCKDAASSEGCASLGADRGSGLRRMLALSERDLVRLLSLLALPRDFSCEALCDAAVRRIPTVLKSGIPDAVDVGCLTPTCHEKADVSPAHLREVGLKTTEHGSTDGRVVLTTGPVGGTQHQADSEQLLSRLLGVVLRVFPAMQVEEAGALLEADSGADPKFGPRVRIDRYGEYARYNAMAFSWVSEAIRKLDSGRHHVKKWFNLKEERAVDRQLEEARYHMTMMLDLYGKIYIKKGKGPGEGGICRETPLQGTMAYVQTYVGCTVADFRDCGLKEDGRYVINICEYLWSPSFDDADRIGTLVHESSHHFGTDDHGYCDGVNCLALPPRMAATNADTYANLVRVLVQDSSLSAVGSIKRPECRDFPGVVDTDASGRNITCREVTADLCEGPTSRDYYRGQCPITCDACPDGSQPRLDYGEKLDSADAVAVEVECEDAKYSGYRLNGGTFASCSGAVSLGMPCTDDLMRTNCKKTCGLCPEGFSAGKNSAMGSSLLAPLLAAAAAVGRLCAAAF